MNCEGIPELLYFEGIAELLYEAYRKAWYGGPRMLARKPAWKDLGRHDRDIWIAVAKEAHRVIAAAVLA